MTNLFLFLILFVIVSYSLSLYSEKSKSRVVISENKIISLDRNSISYMAILSLIPVLLVTFRDRTTGTDTESYFMHFTYGESYMEKQIKESGEFLFWFIFKFCKVYFDIRVAFFIFAFISILFGFFAIFKLSNRANVFVMTMIYLLLYYQECFNILRQMCAMAFVFLGYSYLLDKKNKMFIALIIIAFMFHSSSIFALPLLFIYENKKLSGIGGIIGVLVSIFLVAQLPNIFSYISDTLGITRFAGYAEDFSKNNWSDLGWLKSFLLSVPAYFILFVIQCSNQDKLDKSSNLDISFFWYTILIVSACSIMRMYTNWIFRIGYYYQLGGIIFAGVVCKSKSDTNIRSLVFEKNSFMNTSYILLYYTFYYFFLNYYNNFATSALVNFKLN